MNDPGDAPAPVVEAGGGIVRRRGRGGDEILLVHRPRYDDWTLPKGKLDAADGGDIAACALREVAEETGYRCRLGSPAGEIRYRTRIRGGGEAAKVVRYWHMDVLGGEFVPNREVDEIRWLPLPDALGLLSYERDRMLLRKGRAG